jgi:glycosyltransferase involved in cell wall biosynthesis
MTSPAVTVVLSTFNRCRSLRPALDALVAQTGDVSYEVIVVDNNSTDATRAVVESRLKTAPQLRYLFEAQQGLPYARNAGLAAAQAPIIAFTDDDVRVPSEWVSRIKRAFDANPDVDMIGGRVVPIWPADMPPWITRRQLGPFALGERGDVPFRVHAGNAAPCLVGANFAFRRDVFARIGPFDPAYTKSQDREIQLRLWRSGGQGLYVPEIAIEVEVPIERITKEYFRYWYTTYGRYHSRMRLLDTLDRNGRLVPPPARAVRGVPLFLYRELFDSATRWMAGQARLDRTDAFYWENRTRYIFSYIRERHREHA